MKKLLNLLGVIISVLILYALAISFFFYFFIYLSNHAYPMDKIYSKSISEIDSLKNIEDSIKISKWLIVLDPAHGIETPGKRSPDGRFREYLFSREILSILSKKFDSVGIHYKLDNETIHEIGLSKRRAVTNKYVSKYKGRSLFISIHCNAIGDGRDWMNARGFSVWTTRGNTKSDIFAQILSDSWDETFPDVRNLGLYEANFAVLRCHGPAVLLETLFQDNKQDVDILLDDFYRNKYCDMIICSIKKFILK
jgi:N-acetylmuramoyl-L-alanine amidase